jgi:hypothetical protein
MEVANPSNGDEPLVRGIQSEVALKISDDEEHFKRLAEVSKEHAAEVGSVAVPDAMD